MIRKVCIFCGSSPRVNEVYLDAASEVGKHLALASIAVNYGCGAFGLMGALADSMLANKGVITGIIPSFMVDFGWSNPKISETIITHDMRERKKLMIKDVDAVIALPGGIGTLEELTEVITLKQLGQFLKPIILLNTSKFYNHLTAFLEEMIRQEFMSESHRKIWTLVNTPAEIVPAIENSKDWSARTDKYPTSLPE
ncbi:MAG TPA: TIGR00730 family Rossman fold protein [Bacteroidales bacterium]|nr:TIGR00730 family Rossman fold protein [Bacteroidales bacterium]